MTDETRAPAAAAGEQAQSSALSRRSLFLGGGTLAVGAAAVLGGRPARPDGPGSDVLRQSRGAEVTASRESGRAETFFASVRAKPLWLLLAGLAVATPVALSASHHFESDIARKHPQFDLTDLFVFESRTPGKTVFVLDANPATGKDGKAAFGENGLYNIHIATDRSLASGLTLTFRFSNGGVVIGRLATPNAPLGTEGEQLGFAASGEARLPNGMRVWTGAARDPFVGNGAGLTKFRAALAKGRYDIASFAEGKDLFAAANSSIIVLEVPNAMLPKDMQVFASSAMQLNGHWIQVNRLANPLLTHLFLVSDEVVAGDHVRHRPDDDAQRLLPLSGNVLRAVTLAGTEKDPVAYADGVAQRLLPDLLPYKVGTKARFAAGSVNGRRPTDDAMDAMLTLFSGKTVTDGANTFDRHPGQFPYVVPLKPSGRG